VRCITTFAIGFFLSLVCELPLIVYTFGLLQDGVFWYAVLAVLNGFSVVLLLMFGEVLFCRTPFKMTATYIGSLTASTMLVAGMWFGLLR
jgi:hypothetical protein